MAEDTGVSADQRAVRDVLARFSAAWQSRRYEELDTYIDEGFIMAAPGFQGRMAGRDAGVESFREFMGRVAINRYQVETHSVDVWATPRWKPTVGRWPGTPAVRPITRPVMTFWCCAAPVRVGPPRRAGLHGAP